jgi:hypothetical protein
VEGDQLSVIRRNSRDLLPDPRIQLSQLRLVRSQIGVVDRGCLGVEADKLVMNFLNIDPGVVRIEPEVGIAVLANILVCRRANAKYWQPIREDEGRKTSPSSIRSTVSAT